ncbi:serine carboxypeptidase-like 35 [Amborella trichopoda]|uniref:serine carboxypeptidase-like 35 n=1 Tax=Amborella trichopoda TaxID=13333 RepID=UPI0005D3E9BE|nr:serine carboxypeptidase-like 35 [Amborella trichopoda]|eukprot:XP_011624635.1 serine carboxypeptidase-like 35 [Amborella trichopoda]
MADYGAVLLCIFISFLQASYAIAAKARAESSEDDLVLNLPGQPPVEFRHYSGYVRLREGDGKALFYWFFEAQGNVSEKPLLLWLNGGPGCSSIAYGASLELGPFLIRNNQSKLIFNNYSWNKVANLLFLEAPVGVGYSYTNKSEDLLVLGDRITAEDSRTFLLNWFKKFRSFKSHDFYIAGESYAGHYVPQLAELIYDGNKHSGKESYINLKGIMIGNAVMNDETDEMGMIDYAWSHALISDALYHTIKKECNFKSDNQTIPCLLAMRSSMEVYEEIDIYSLYTPICLATLDKTSRKRLLTHSRLFSSNDLRGMLPSGYDPCNEHYAEAFFNRKDVQRALHANVTDLPYAYSSCSEVIKKWNDSPESILPIITKLITAGLRVWVYSGDTDARIPVTSTRYSLEILGMKTKVGWRPWFNEGQVAGFAQVYEGGLTFASVYGAGHQVPVLRPQQALSLLVHFLAGDPLPPSRF